MVNAFRIWNGNFAHGDRLMKVEGIGQNMRTRIQLKIFMMSRVSVASLPARCFTRSEDGAAAKKTGHTEDTMTEGRQANTWLRPANLKYEQSDSQMIHRSSHGDFHEGQ
ncbi:hypothetical protein RvY_03122 [Ramazzottius varieornatus]|uniref:Uncharacterized protein n=1 Tax=Ramazzottius varieornatus TaxID=947166 RepID=A0A1D1UU15_RAMVA|nr:hypothetical protein RvY_03122 [Ramazzottius varieornatus]